MSDCSNCFEALLFQRLYHLPLSVLSPLLTTLSNQMIVLATKLTPKIFRARITGMVPAATGEAILFFVSLILVPLRLVALRCVDAVSLLLLAPPLTRMTRLLLTSVGPCWAWASTRAIITMRITFPVDLISSTLGWLRLVSFVPYKFLVNNCWCFTFVNQINNWFVRWLFQCLRFNRIPPG